MLDGVAIFAAVMAAMAVHAVAGFGFAQFVAPILLLSYSGLETVSTLLLLALIINVLIVSEGRPAGFQPRDLALVTPGALLGLPVGAVLVGAVDKDALQALVGAAILLAAALQVRSARTRASVPAPGHERELCLAAVAGGLSGVLTTTTAIGAAPVILWLERRAPGGGHLRYAIAAYSILLCAVGATLLIVQHGSQALGGLEFGLILTPAVFIGHWIGKHAFVRLDDSRYRRVVLALVVVAGLSSILSALL